MPLELLEFLLILALAFGGIYFLLGSNHAASGWRAKLGVAVIGIVGASATLVAMLAGPVPTILLVVALVAFIADRSSKEPLDWRALSGFVQDLMGLIENLKKRIPELAARADYLGPVPRHPAVAYARRALETRIAKSADRLQAFVQSITQKLNRAQAARDANRFHGEQSSISAGPSEIEATLPAMPSVAVQPAPDAEVTVSPEQRPRRLSRDQVKLLLDVLEGRNIQPEGQHPQASRGP